MTVERGTRKQVLRGGVMRLTFKEPTMISANVKGTLHLMKSFRILAMVTILALGFTLSACNTAGSAATAASDNGNMSTQQSQSTASSTNMSTDTNSDKNLSGTMGQSNHPNDNSKNPFWNPEPGDYIGY
jgi:hypothetical protein